MTAALEGSEWSAAHTLAALYPKERPGTHCTGGWVGPRAGLDGRKISSPPGETTILRRVKSQQGVDVIYTAAKS